MTVRLKTVLGLILVLLLSGCSKSLPPQQRSEEQLAGQALFEQHCSRCHPREGRGDYLRRIPTTLLVKKSDQELKTWIRGIGEHREMPSFTFLTETELRALVTYLHAEVDKHY